VVGADRVVSGGDARQLEELLVRAVREGLHAHVARLENEHPPADDVAAGRRWVAAYVPFVHWAEGVHAAASGAGPAHAGRPANDAAPKAAAAASGDHAHHH
jgi:hypothetical protein